MGFAYSQMGAFEKSAASFLNAIQAAQDAGDKKGHWQAAEGFAAVSFLQGQYDRAVEYYKCALAVLSSTADDTTEHNERIISKLANALECQLILAKKGKRAPMTKQSQGTSPTGQKPPIPKKDVEDSPRRRISRTRPRPENHKLIARGIDGDQTDSSDGELGSDSTTGISSGSDSESAGAREKQKYVLSQWERKTSRSRTGRIQGREGPSKQNVEVEVHRGHGYDHRHPQRTLPPPDYPDDDSGLYEQPVDGRGGYCNRKKIPPSPDLAPSMARSHREAYLASLAASQAEVNRREERNTVTESRTCVIQ